MRQIVDLACISNVFFLNFKTDIDGRPMSPISPINIDESFTMSLRADSYNENWIGTGWMQTNETLTAKAAVNQVSDFRSLFFQNYHSNRM